MAVKDSHIDLRYALTKFICQEIELKHCFYVLYCITHAHPIYIVTLVLVFQSRKIRNPDNVIRMSVWQ